MNFRTKFKHAARFTRRLATHPLTPRWVRWLAVAALLPIPGPVDEIIAVILLILLTTFKRDLLRLVWNETE